MHIIVVQGCDFGPSYVVGGTNCKLVCRCLACSNIGNIVSFSAQILAFLQIFGKRRGDEAKMTKLIQLKPLFAMIFWFPLGKFGRRCDFTFHFSVIHIRGLYC